MQHDVDSLGIKTLDDVISYSTFYDIDRYLILDKDGNINTTLFDKYYAFIRPFVKRVRVTREHKIYQFRPKLLSKALYKTPNLDWILIKLNNQTPSRFIMGEFINIIDPDNIDEIFNFLSSKLNS